MKFLLTNLGFSHCPCLRIRNVLQSVLGEILDLSDVTEKQVIKESWKP